MKVTLIVIACSFLVSVSTYAQQQSVTVEYMENGKLVHKVYEGTELAKLMKDAELKAAAAHKHQVVAPAPTQMQVVIQEPGKTPVTYKGAELVKLEKKAALAQQQPRPLTIPANTATAVWQADGSVKITKNGVESISK